MTTTMRRNVQSSAIAGMILIAPVVLVLCTTPTVKGAQQSFRVSPKNSSVLEGGEATLHCEVQNLAGRVQWAKDGFATVNQPNGEIAGTTRLRLIGDPSHGVFNLNIRNASLSDDGIYECQVGPYNGHKPIRSVAHLTVNSPPQSVAITNHEQKKVVTVKVGETVKLECTVRLAKPPAKIVWYRGNVQIKGGDTIEKPISVGDDKDIPRPDNKDKLKKYDTYGYIYVTSTAEDNDMTYTCEAKHPAIHIDRPMRANIKLSVYYAPGPPYIEGYQEGESLRRGQQVDLACKTRGGNPAAQVIWRRNGELIKSVYRTEGSLSENIHTFIAKAEDDKAKYECEVSNVMSVDPMKVHVVLSVLFPPSKVKISGPKEARAEDTVTLTCTTENSNPAVEIQWDMNGHKHNGTSRIREASQGGYITTSNITFNINKAAEKIVAVCHALNKRLTETIVGTHTINVIYPPTSLNLIGHEENRYINAGTLLNLACIATSGSPAPNITWYKNDKQVTKVTTKSKKHTETSELSIQVNASYNNARIRCEATNSAMQIPLVNETTLKVRFPPDLANISTEPKEFRAGGTGRLICESSSSNPPAEVSWWKSGRPVEGVNNRTTPGLYGGTLSRIELYLDLNENMNGETYTCQAKNVEIDRSVHDAITLNILYKPAFASLDPSELTGMAGEPFVISVSALANPNKITYTWKRNGLPVSTGGKRIIARGPTLNITRLERTDSGTYVCEASNDVGTTSYHLNLTIQYPAKIIRTSKSGQLHPPNVEAKLFCAVDGSPMGDEFITWYKDGTSLEQTGRYSMSFANKTSYLHIENPGKQDVGEFRCNVNNGIGNDTSHPILFITHFPPDMANTPLTRKAAANKGITAQLYCTARGSPLPQFTWVFDGRPLLPNLTDSKYGFTHSNLSELSAQSILRIAQVSASDYGTYECRARNSMGEATDTIQLDVTSPPDQPTDFEMVNVTHDSVFLTWKRGFDGGLPTKHQIRWRPAIDYESRYHYMDVSPGDYKAVVTGLTLGTYYVFSIKAMNAKGESKFLPDTLKVQTLREPPPNQLTASEINSSYVIVIIIVVSACACLLIATPIVYATFVSKKKAQRSGINKSQAAEMYAPSTVNGDTMTGELSSVSDEKSDVNFDANDYVDEGRKTAASTYLIDPSMGDYSKSSLEMQVHQQSTLSRRSNHMMPGMLNMDSPPQRTTASGTLSVSKSSYIGNPSPAPPSDGNFYSVEMETGLYTGYETNPSPGPTMNLGPGAYYPSLGSMGHVGMHATVNPLGSGTLTRNRTLPRPVPPPDVTVMTAGAKSPLPPSVPPPPGIFARAGPIPAHSLGHQLSTFTSTPTYSDIDGHLV